MQKGVFRQFLIVQYPVNLKALSITGITSLRVNSSPASSNIRYLIAFLAYHPRFYVFYRKIGNKAYIYRCLRPTQHRKNDFFTRFLLPQEVIYLNFIRHGHLYKMIPEDYFKYRSLLQVYPYLCCVSPRGEFFRLWFSAVRSQIQLREGIYTERYFF